METELKGKIALVTGAGRGIGKAIALALARDGGDIAINDIDSADAEEPAEEIRALGRKSMVALANVVEEAEVREMMDRVVRQWGGIDILVNNAGIASLILVEDMDKAEWDRVVDVNLGGTFNCSRFAIPIMKKRGGEEILSIINIASFAGKRMSMLSAANYSASKAGVLGLTRHLSGEFNYPVAGKSHNPRAQGKPKAAISFWGAAYAGRCGGCGCLFGLPKGQDDHGDQHRCGRRHHSGSRACGV